MASLLGFLPRFVLQFAPIVPGSIPARVSGWAPGRGQKLVPPSVSGRVSESVLGSVPGSVPGSVSGSVSGSVLKSVLKSVLGSVSG